MKNLAVDFNPKILRYLMRESGETLQTLSNQCLAEFFKKEVEKDDRNR